MSAVLGISAYYHDSAAALIVDGKIVAAMQEERFSRRKNDPGLPCRAAHACLEVGGIDAGDLDSVVFYENPYGRLERVVMSSLGAFPRYRRCDTTSGTYDADCYSLASATTFTGTGEVWWAPYDNRPAPSTTTNAQGSPNPDNTYKNGGYPAGFLWPYLEGNPKTYKCPNGIS